MAVSLENLSLTANRTSLSASVRVRSKARIVPAWSVRIILPYEGEHNITTDYTIKLICSYAFIGTHPVIEFNDEMIGCLIGAKLHIHHPVHTKLAQ